MALWQTFSFTYPPFSWSLNFIIFKPWQFIQFHFFSRSVENFSNNKSSLSPLRYEGLLLVFLNKSNFDETIILLV